MWYSLARKALFSMPEETAHQMALKSLDIAACVGASQVIAQPVASTPVEVMGIRFPNPVGLAAGLDKNGDHIMGLASVGFGSLEIGTVTPRPQPGNPQPRLFRIPERQAIINRMGFNNLGVDHLIRQVRETRYRGVLGINIGKNFNTPVEQAESDYLIGMERVYDYASYITVNVSSPNTPGLRNLQFGDTLNNLLSALKDKQQQLSKARGVYKPVAVKIAPDMNSDEINQVAKALLNYQIDGVIATNTTVERAGIEGCAHAEEAGGLSGAPLTQQSTKVIAELASIVDGKLPIIGVGGIVDGESAAEKIRAGASLVQVYTGFIYRGPELISESVEAINQLGLLQKKAG